MLPLIARAEPSAAPTRVELVRRQPGAELSTPPPPTPPSPLTPPHPPPHTPPPPTPTPPPPPPPPPPLIPPPPPPHPTPYQPHPPPPPPYPPPPTPPPPPHPPPPPPPPFVGVGRRVGGGPAGFRGAAVSKAPEPVAWTTTTGETVAAVTRAPTSLASTSNEPAVDPPTTADLSTRYRQAAPDLSNLAEQDSTVSIGGSRRGLIGDPCGAVAVTFSWRLPLLILRRQIGLCTLSSTVHLPETR